MNSSDPEIVGAAAGRGVGRIGAHEVGHQLALTAVKSDSNLRGYYDGGDSSDPTCYDETGQMWTGGVQGRIAQQDQTIPVERKDDKSIMKSLTAKSAFISFLCCGDAACILAAVVFQTVPPLSKIGQRLFWPQNYIDLLDLRPNDPAGTRISFFVVSAILTGFMLAFLSLMTKRRRLTAFSGLGPGVLSVTGPMLVGLLVVPLTGISVVLMLVETICLIFYVSYCFHTKRQHKFWEYILMSLLFGWWIYLFRAQADPLFMSVPVASCLAY
ncbi:MAG TPA: hypothetical protein VKD70_14355, partial [Candidatus Acidoferrum sp.]|nr:hypothetical protein [Candidatus Acidoferrum sp.]